MHGGNAECAKTKLYPLVLTSSIEVKMKKEMKPNVTYRVQARVEYFAETPLALRRAAGDGREGGWRVLQTPTSVASTTGRAELRYTLPPGVRLRPRPLQLSKCRLPFVANCPAM